MCAYENRVGGDTEGIFNDDFYEGLTGEGGLGLRDCIGLVCECLVRVEVAAY